MTTPCLEGLAHAAWETYYNEYLDRYGIKPHRIGTTFGNSKMYAAFTKIAAMCIREGYNVRDYITFCFNHIEKDRIYITPNDFHKSKFIGTYRQYKKTNNLTKAEETYNAQLRLLAILMTKMPDIYSNEKAALKTFNNAFSAWFRIFYPAELDTDLLRYYGKAAFMELKNDRALRNFIRGIRKNNLEQFEDIYGIFGDGE